VDRDAEVRANVFASGPTKSSAVVTALIGDEERETVADLQERTDLGLDSVSVFDAACAELYVDKSNAIAFVPSDLRLLARLASTQERMRSDIDGRMRSLRSTAPTFADLPEGTRAREVAERLSATTPADELRALATLDDEGRHRLVELQGLVAAASTNTAAADAGSARHDAKQAEALAAELQQLVGLVNAEGWARANRAASLVSDTRAALGIGAAVFADLPVSDVGGDAWRRLWEAARAFANDVSEPFPPEASSHCLLCLRPLDARRRTG